MDVLIAGTPPGSQGPNGPKAKTLLQNIQVLSAGQNYQKDMTRIQATDIPSGMRQTLQDPQYKGWENSDIYKSNSNNGYMLQMNTGGQVQSYQFDSEGKLVPKPKP